MCMASTSITHLALHQFRNHSALELHTDAPFVIITGENGVGKTNILEAVSLFSPGRGFRNAAPSIQRSYDADNTPWAIRATLRNGETEERIATASAPPPLMEKRIIKINGEIISRQQELLGVAQILWFLPTMSHLFSESSSIQRRFFDRMVYGFEREHSTRLNAYEHYMRERRRLLAQHSTPAAWLSSIERSMAEYSVAIGYSRLQMTTRLNQTCDAMDPVFPRAQVRVLGDAETLLRRGMPALEVEALLCDRLEALRSGDKARGRCGAGAHKSCFEVAFMPDDRPAATCSTGEQKALLLSLLLAQIYAQIAWNGRAPIVLLDEVVAHLDANRRDALFAVLRKTGAQCWTTGTDVADFSAIAPHEAQYVKLEAKQLVQQA